MNDPRESIFNRLKHSLQILASSPEVQLRLLPSFVVKADELALEFDHWRIVVLHNYSEDFTSDQLSALTALDAKLVWLTTSGNKHWTDQAVRESSGWREIRELATGALNKLGWPIETPPSYSHEYVLPPEDNSQN